LHDGSLRDALHHLKYRHDLGLGEIMAGKMAAVVQNNRWQPDLVIPVPLGVKRQRERGYNQAAVLAQPLAMMLGLAYTNKALYRIRETRSQVGLDREQRKMNMDGVFSAESKWVKDKNVLLVDDVMTTGATLNAASVALRQAGAVEVWAITLARAA
jgi:ComF family protein